MRVKEDGELYVGASNRMAIALTAFKLDDDNKAVILDANSADEEKLREAAESCLPSTVIVADDKGNRLYP